MVGKQSRRICERLEAEILDGRTPIERDGLALDDVEWRTAGELGEDVVGGEVAGAREMEAE